MSYNERKLRFSPTLCDGVEVRTTDAAMGDCDLDVLRLEVLGLELANLQIAPFGWI